MNSIRKFFARQRRLLAQAYEPGSGIQFRAANLCNLMVGFFAVLPVLIIFAILVDPTSMTAKRVFYIGLMVAILALAVTCYHGILRGHFKIARSGFMSVNLLFVVPAVMVTGGLPASPTMIMMPLPILYAFCLYDGRQSIMFAIGYSVTIILMVVVPTIFDINLPNYTQGDLSPARKIVTFLILIAMLVFTLISLQIENQYSVYKAREAAQAKSAFLANMSHEIRTPMNGVLGLTEVLMAKDMPHEQKGLLRVIHDSGQSLLVIINDILDFSKLDAGQVELDPVPFNLKHVLRDIYGLLRLKTEEKGLYFKLEYKVDCPDEFVGDVGRLRQVLLNIVGNAIKFTETGGITLGVSMKSDGKLRIDVRDTGIGIAKDKIEHLFGQFTQAEVSTTRKFGGTGLGLSISRQLVRIMDGDIIVTSNLGEGAVFSIQVPLPVVETNPLPVPDAPGLSLAL